jgi:GTP-binding protein
MFIDEKELQVKAGKGGDGAALFRREIYVPRGGPDGGDGGNGGDIFVIGKNNLHALTHLGHVNKIDAENGVGGGHRQSTGKSGSDTYIEVPLGTVIYCQKQTSELQDPEWEIIGEITEEKQTILLAKGGHGGWGNWHFKSSVQQAPTRFNPGLPGEKKEIKFELKLIADIGLIGLPNAGKSFFLQAVSSAHPKIANYPFTTLEPQLGVATIKDKENPRQWVIADLPGLIEGASSGKGLGDKFLRHIERTKSLIHFLDITQNPDQIKTNYLTIRNELAAWKADLLTKPELIALSKIDLVPAEDLPSLVKKIEKSLGKKVYPISSFSQKGILELLRAA